MKVKGIGASGGYGIGKVFKYEKVTLTIEDYKIEDVEKEINTFHASIMQSEKELEQLKEKVRLSIDDAHAEIFEAHLQILNDPTVSDDVENAIREEKKNASFALEETIEKYVVMFESLDDAYMRQRAVDIKDVFFRVQCHLHQVHLTSLADITEPVIIVCDDLTPSDTAQLDKSLVLGFVTNIGARTSHSAIMARSLEIPAVLGTLNITEKVTNEDVLIIDGTNGEVLVNPDETLIQTYEQKISEHEAYQSFLSTYRDKETRTKCGRHITLAANIGSENDLEQVIKYGAEGIGLFRTEFLYMNSQELPTEEHQYDVYKKVLSKMKDKPVVIRTLDIGGDKHLPYLELPEEMNPFLGHRAIRLCFEKEEILRTQLRALLRASVHGQLKIMFPMIATIDEFLKAKDILLSVKKALLKENIEVSDAIEVGIMVEIPAAAVLADQFAKYVDFFSIGTNDLIQYTFAADRMNKQVAYLYQPFNPSLLRLIHMVAKAGHATGKWVGMCGEMAGDLLAAPLLVGLGLTELSMSATSILPIRKKLEDLSYDVLKEHAQNTLTYGTSFEVEKVIREI